MMPERSNSRLPLVPYPREVVRRPGGFRWRPATQAFIAPDADTLSIRHKLDTLGCPVVVDDTVASLSVVLGRPRRVAAKPPAQAEGYLLHSDEEAVVIRGADADGLFWGLVTLEQLIRRGACPHVTIRDWPMFGLRYHHDDVSRKQISTVADFKRIIRLLSSYKIKYYTLYLEDMLYLKSFPDIGVGRGRLMPGEVREILAEAQRQNVTVFPTFSLIGHQENLLASPRYRHLAREVFQSPSSFDPAKPALKPFLRKVIRDVCALFPDAPFIHAGFDETQGVPERDLIGHANWCAAELGAQGKRMLMWVDMFKNHFGREALKKLAPGIIPVEWDYSDPRPSALEYRRVGVAPLGLAGYSNWGCHLPDFRAGKANIDHWITAARRMRSSGFGASQWGDDGYENSRDLCWNLFAYYAEAAWTGVIDHGCQFEQRFQSTYYGRPLPALRQVIEDLSPRRQLSPRESWRLFRVPMAGLVRCVTIDPTLARRAKADLALCDRMLHKLNMARVQARREAGQIDSIIVAVERQRLVANRLLVAQCLAAGRLGTQQRITLLDAHLREHRRVRDHYQRVWKASNKPPNIEVSLRVFKEVEASCRPFLHNTSTKVPVRYRCLDMDAALTSFHEGVAGVPIGLATADGIPFRFAGTRTTHAVVADGQVLRLAFDRVKVLDIHLIYGGLHVPAESQSRIPMLEVRLFDGEREVLGEELLSITHICDWFAPRGEHMWAGGGLRYADAKRVTFALSPNLYHGLMHLRGFKVRDHYADRIEFRALPVPGAPQAGVALFGVTLETESRHEKL